MHASNDNAPRLTMIRPTSLTVWVHLRRLTAAPSIAVLTHRSGDLVPAAANYSWPKLPGRAPTCALVRSVANARSSAESVDSQHTQSISAFGATIRPVPRPLTDHERDILGLLLSVDFAGAVELRQQAASVSADREGMIIDLLVDSEASRASVISRTPVQAVVDGDGYDGGLILFVDDGRLSALEYWWVTQDRPDVMPPLSAIGAPII